MNTTQSFSVHVAVLLGGAEMAILLESLYDMSLNNAQHVEMIADGNVWVKCSRSFLRSKFPYISDWRIRAMLDKLVDTEYITRGSYSEHDMDKSSWFSLTNKAISLFEGVLSPLDDSTNAPDGNAPFLLKIAQKTAFLREREKESNIKKESKEKKKEDKKIENSISKDIQKKEEKKEESSFCENGTLFGGSEVEDCIERPIATSQTPTKKEGANRAAATLAERESAFKDECQKFVEEFGERLVEEFVLYWTEPNKSRSKMRFEQQPTWDTHRRMLTWKRNNFNKYEQNVNVEAPKEISAAEIESLMNWRRND